MLGIEKCGDSSRVLCLTAEETDREWSASLPSVSETDFERPRLKRYKNQQAREKTRDDI